MTLPHSIGAQRILIDVATEEIARELLPRMGDINQRTMVPILERVVSELAVPGTRIKLDKLEIDLGTLSVPGFETDLGERLERELRTALGDAIRAAQEQPSAEGWAQSEVESQLDLLEQVLLLGTLPFWASEGRAFSFEAHLLSRVDEDPEGLTRLLHRHRGSTVVLERLVRQLGDAALARLLQTLEPEGAALILAYLLDLRAVHRTVPLVDLPEEVHARVLWILVLTYVLRDPGSQFNRKSFVLSLLEGLAASEGIEYLALLKTLEMGLLATAKHLTLGSSLPAVVGEILADLGRKSEAEELLRAAKNGGEKASREGLWALLEHGLLYGTLPSSAGPAEARSFEALVLYLLMIDPARVSLLVRRHGAQRRTLERIVGELAEEPLRLLLAALEPESAATIIGYLIEVRIAHRTAALIPLDEETLRRELWILSLTYLVRDAGSHFNRKSFLISLLSGMAQAHRGRYLDLLETLRVRLIAPPERPLLGSSLPAVLAEILADNDRTSAPGEVESASTDREEAVSRRSLLEVFEDYLLHGAAPSAAGSTGDFSFEALLLDLVAVDPASVSRLVRRHGSSPRTLERLVVALTEPPRQRLLRAIEPDAATTIIAYLVDLREVHRADPLAATSAETFDRRLWILTLTYVARDPGSQFNRKSFLRSLLVGFAASEALDLGQLLVTLQLGLDRLASHQALGSSLAAIVVELIDDEAREPSPRHLHLQLPEATLARMVAALAPRNHALLIATATLIAAAWRAVALPGQPAIDDRSMVLSALLDILSRPGGAELSVEQLTIVLFEYLARRSPIQASPGGEPSLEERLLAQVARLAGDAGNASLRAALQHRNDDLLAAWRGAVARGTTSTSATRESEPAKRPPDRPAPPKRPPAREAPRRGEVPSAPEELGGAPVFLDNAGLVLAGAFLPHLFRGLDFLRPDAKGALRMRDRETASRAVHLTQYLVDGRTDAPEPTLVLNKVVCGLPTDAAIARDIAITDVEREICDKLLRSMIASWPSIANTSVAGLRETFLRREGKLTRQDDRFALRVQRKTVDVLVDQLPWSISIVVHPWMLYPLYVTW